MTREEKRKAIDTLEKSVPVIAMTQEEFNDYIQTVNQIMGWLEQEPCEDAISRQEAIDKMQELEDEDIKAYSCKIPEGFDGKRAIEALKVLQPVTPQPKMGRWIPVSERLPEIHQDVLLSLRSLDVEVGFRGNTEPYYYCHGDYIEPQNVLAWQPLPEPYKAESEVSDANSN